MINSRRTKDNDSKDCCARCKHLKLMPSKGSSATRCSIDGAIYSDPELLTMFVCDKYKEVENNGRV